MKHVLVVDDAATIRAFHRKILEDHGFQTDEAMNGLEAMEKVLENQYDLLVVDINMPTMDGISLLQQVRSLAIRQMPAIVVSTESATVDRKAAWAAGANMFLIKPARPEALLTHCRLLTGWTLP